MLVAAFGTVVEWYDFSIFFYVATTLTKEFFGGQADSPLLTLGVGAAGFLFRPLGAMVFGHLGDRVGRKHALVVSAVLMAVSMLGIAIMPDYNTIGIWAGVGLVFFRCLSGFSVGAEYTGIMVFLMESAKPGKRGLAASWAAANSEVGALLAVGSGALLANTLSTEAMESWGWRVLFVLGAVLAALMVPPRRMMVETDTFKRLQKAEKTDVVLKRSPLITAILEQPRAIIVAFLISSIGSVSYFLNITYVPTYVEEVAQVPNSGSLALGTVAAVVAIVVTPFFGLASDRFGREGLPRRSHGRLHLHDDPRLCAPEQRLGVDRDRRRRIPRDPRRRVERCGRGDDPRAVHRHEPLLGHGHRLQRRHRPLRRTLTARRHVADVLDRSHPGTGDLCDGHRRRRRRPCALPRSQSMAKKSLAEIDEDRHLVPA